MAGWKKPIWLAIVGAEKAGTTALFRHLAQSPVFVAHAQPEMTYFVNDDAYARGEQWAVDQYFPDSDGRHWLMKDVMLMNFETGLRRLKSSSPDVQVVAMLREPASRAWSAYNYARSRGVESAGSFAEALELEAARMRDSKWSNRVNLYLYNSTYADKIARLYDIFGRDNTLVLYQENYREAPGVALHQIGDRLGVDLYPDVAPDFSQHNSAAQARSQTVAAMTAKVFRSRGGIKKLLRPLVPARAGTSLRQALLRLNRAERPNQPVPPAIAEALRTQLADDARQLAALVGHCPWAPE